MPLGRARHLRDLADQPAGVGEAAAGGQPHQPLTGGDERADPVAATAREVRDGGERGDREVALLAGRGAEVEAGRKVHEHPRLQLAVGHGLAHMRLAGAGGDRPVDAPHVVAGLVGAGLAQLGAGAGHEAEVVALQQPVQPDPHRQLERLERGLQPPFAQ